MSYATKKYWDKAAQFTLIVICLMSGYLSFRGLKEESDYFVALLRTGASIIVSYFVWRFLFSELPRARNTMARTVMVWGAIISVGVILALSSWYSFLGISKKKAVNHVHQQLLADASDDFDELLSLRGKEVGIKSQVEAVAGVFNRLSKNESKHGVISKHWRRGPVAASLRSLSDGFEQLADELEQQNKKIKQLQYLGHKKLSELRDLIDDDELDVETKNNLVQKKLNGIAEINYQLNECSIVDSVTARTEQIENLFFVNQSEKVLEAVKMPIAESKALILSELQELELHEVRIRRYRVLSPTDSVLESLSILLPEILSAVVVDVGIPGTLLLFIFYVSKFSSESEEEQMEANPSSRSPKSETLSQNEKRTIGDVLAEINHIRPKTSVGGVGGARC